MGLLRKNGTGSYKLIFRVYDPVLVGKKVEVGLSTNHPDEARYRAMIVMRALHLAGLAATPSMNVAIVATGKDGEELSCAVNQNWIEERILSCRHEMLKQVRDARIRELEGKLREVRSKRDHLRRRLYDTEKRLETAQRKEAA